MVDTIYFIVDFLSIWVSLFSIFVSVSIYLKYRIYQINAFILTAIGIFLWDLSHIYYDLLPSTDHDSAEIVWYVANITGGVILVSTLHGFNALRKRHLTNRLLMFDLIIAVLLTIQLSRPDVLSYTYDYTTHSWKSVVNNELIWNMYIVMSFIMLYVEILHPLFRTTAKVESKKRRVVIFLIISISLSMLSNLLLPILTAIGAPQSIRHLSANTGFLFTFLILLRDPFVGFYDSVQIHQIIIADKGGKPIFSTGDDGNANLATSALFGIDAVLTEIGSLAGVTSDKGRGTRQIELAENRFYIQMERKYVLIYHYSKHTNVAINKFEILSHIFSDDQEEINVLLKEFILTYDKFFPDSNLEFNQPSDSYFLEKLSELK
ncbi:MAG: hypothetical protein INQ03_22350 [Candidatus Heimdallarchaeota archaeon]|nr:hypothetical protein [Candidatus Heimdallarchaeota archaeon]